MSRGYVLFDTPCGGSLQDLPCPVSSKLHLLSGLLETLGEGASFLCQPVSGEKKKKPPTLGNNSLSPAGTMCSSPAVWPCAPDGNGAFCRGVQTLPSTDIILSLDLQVRQTGTALLEDPVPAAFC